MSAGNEEIKHEVIHKDETNKIPPIDSFKITNSDGSIMYRRIIEANDSCLFNAIGLSLMNSLNES